MNNGADAPQSDSWDKRALHWRQAAPKGASTNDQSNQRLIEWAGISSGCKCLDLASGAGEPAISIAISVGNEGSIIASDASAEMLKGAQSRAAHLGLENIGFEHASVEDLPFDDNSFDAVTCRFGLMHAKDPFAGLVEARRVLKPGTKGAFVVHGTPELNAQWVIIHQCVQSFLGIDDQARFDKHFKFCQTDELTSLMQKAGFSAVHDELFVTNIVEKSDKVFWGSVLMRSLGSRVETLKDAEMAKLNTAIEAAMNPFLDKGMYTFPSSYRIAAGIA